MFGKGEQLTRKKAVRWVIVGVAVCIFLILLRWSGASPDVSTAKGREAYLHTLGWEIDSASEEYRTVVIPSSLDGVMADYARMQTEQGFDLSKYCGKSCGQYSYTVTNYPNCDDTVYVTLYVYGKIVIAGDIHTASLDGFMHGLKREGG